MPNIDYLKIFRDAWKITWSNRFLWWFGFFLLMSGGLNFNYFSSGDEKYKKDWQAIAEKINLEDFLSKHLTLIIIGLGILLTILLIFSVLSFIGRGALIKSTQKILKKETTNFRSGFQDGKKYFWRIFSIFFFSGLFVFICLIVLSAPIIILFATKSQISASIIAFFAILIIIPLLILTKYIKTYACFYVVLADLRPWLAVENAYAIFKKNIFASIVMSLLFIPLSILSFFVIITIALSFLAVFGLIGLALFFAFEKVGVIIAVTAGIICFIFATTVFLSFFSAFSEVAWILFFHVIATPKEKEQVLEREIEDKVAVLPNTEAMKTIEIETEK